MVTQLPEMSLENKTPEGSFGCCFCRDQPRGLHTCVGRLSQSSALHHHTRANVSWTKEQVRRDLKRLGRHGRVSLWSDQELKLVRFLHEGATHRGDLGPIVEHSLVGKSQANNR